MAASPTHELGSLLRRHRRHAGLSQQALGKRVGCHYTYIGRIERGEYLPPPATVTRLAHTLGLTEDETRALHIARDRDDQGQQPQFSEVPPPSPPSLPQPPTSFIGRSQEVMAIRTLLAQDNVRLLTLIGPGGVGKTRLALSVAMAETDRFIDGVFFVPLASLTDATLVPTVIAEVLKVQVPADQEVEQALVDYLSPKHLLLILDTCEHLLSAAPFVGSLHATCSQLSILVTSRTVLHLAAEYTFPVPPLALSPPGRHSLPSDLTLDDAAALFVERARAVIPSFQCSAETLPTIAALCRRLDGLPLAIELAAARLRTFPLQQLHDRLSDRFALLSHGPQDVPERHQTMRATIDWSYALLTPAEQELFARLSVFAGGCTLAAAEQVCNADTQGSSDLIEPITSLLEKSLIQHVADGNEARYRMLDTVREYGVECLTAAGEHETIRRLHARYYLDLAEEAAAGLRGPDQPLLLDRLLAESANLRQALSWSLEDEGNSLLGLRLAVALWLFWSIRGDVGEGRSWFERLLPYTEHVPKDLYAKVFYCAGDLAWSGGDYPRAQDLFARALASAREIGDAHREAAALNGLGIVTHDQGDSHQARTWYETALVVWRALDNLPQVANTLTNLGVLAHDLGQFEEAEQLYYQALAILLGAADQPVVARDLCARLVESASGPDDQALSALFQSMDDALVVVNLLDAPPPLLEQQNRALFDVLPPTLPDREFVADLLNNLANIAHAQDTFDRAAVLHKASLLLKREVQASSGLATSLHNLGRLAKAREQYGHAQELFAAALTRRRALPSPWGIAYSATELGVIHHLQGDDRRAQSLLTEAFQVLRNLLDLRVTTDCLDEAAFVLAGWRRWDESVQLLAASDALRTYRASRRSPAETATVTNVQQAARSALGVDLFDHAWDTGWALNREQAVQTALRAIARGPLR